MQFGFVMVFFLTSTDHLPKQHACLFFVVVTDSFMKKGLAVYT